ncbi:MAG TPA: hypothetical protein VN649_05395 [Ramlibacter sp.]|nr:hypothetical protein [Ramlibacter sp.]
MKIQAFLIAAALAGGAAFAAAPNDTANAPDTSTVTTKKVTKHHRKVTKKTTTRHTVRHATARRANMGAAAAPQTDTSDRAREARMDDALAKYRQSPPQ